MKKVSVVFYAAIFFILTVLSGCKKGNVIELEYKSLSGFKWVSADVVVKGSKDRVMWFQFFDRIEDREKAVQSYANTTAKVAGYPATVYKDKWVWVLINNRFEIRLIADSKSTLFQNTAKLKSFIKMFDIKAMANNNSSQKLTIDELKMLVPKLGMSK